MKIKYILIGLTVLLVIILAIYRFNQSANSPVTPAPSAISVPQVPVATGIIVPTTEISKNTFDIVSVEPKDGSSNISPDVQLEIIFSRPPKKEDIKFYIDPPVESTENIIGTKLVIKPNNALASGVLYTFSVNFTNDKEKNRTYSFRTTGPTISMSSDTRDDQAIADQEAQDLREHPDFYLSNRVPYATESFSVTSDFESNVPAHFYFVVTLKDVDQNKAKQDFISWLKSLSFQDGQISSLDIRYQ